MQLMHASNATASSALADAGDGLAPEVEEDVQLPYLLVSGHKNWAEVAATTSVSADAARTYTDDRRRVATLATASKLTFAQEGVGGRGGARGWTGGTGGNDILHLPEYHPFIPRVNTEETHPAMLFDVYVEGGIKAVLHLLLQQEHLQVTTKPCG
jgi:hypothetical protein